MLFEAGAAILGVAFLVKAGAWPLNFWLVKGYGSAGAPVAAMFSIMTKVGIYALLRIGSLLLPTGAPAAFSLDWMFAAGLATLLFGGLGPVSYTHLDVYKRQIWNRSIRIPPASRVGISTPEEARPKGDDAGKKRMLTRT